MNVISTPKTIVFDDLYLIAVIIIYISHKKFRVLLKFNIIVSGSVIKTVLAPSFSVLTAVNRGIPIWESGVRVESIAAEKSK